MPVQYTRASMRPRSQPVTFNPAAIPNMAGWWKADAITGLSDGDPIATWLDLSGQARDLVQATSAKQPTYKTAILNGLPVARFDGVDDHIELSFAWAQPQTVFMVAVYRGAYLADSALFDSYTNFGLGLFRKTPGTVLQQYAGTALNYSSATPQTLHQYTLRYNAGSSYFRQDRVQVAAGAAGSGVSMNGVTLGADGATGGTTQHADADIGEFLAYGAALTAEQQDAIELYLSSKWGVA